MDINSCEIQDVKLNPHRLIKLWRWDLIHNKVSGNKWFKLWGHYQKMLQEGTSTMVTFGGAFSNHLHAAAHFCNLHQLTAFFFVRGEELELKDNATLNSIRDTGATLYFLSREEYGLKEQSEIFKQVMQRYPEAYIVPEGGSGDEGQLGFDVLKSLIPNDVTDVCVSVGTGTTLRGLRRIFPMHVRLIGISSFKNLELQLPKDYIETHNITLIHFSEFGRFGQVKPDLIAYMNAFYEKNQVPLDVVYTGKMMMGIEHLIDDHFFTSESQILAIHTGGVQGNDSWSTQLIF